MSTVLLQPQGSLSPSEALKVAQEAPSILRRNPAAVSSSPLSLLFTSPETADLWIIYENLLLACLRTANDEAAQQCLERLVRRFGDANPRIMAMKGLVKEAQASSHGDLEGILAEYEVMLEEDPSNVPVTKRKVALLKSMGKLPEASTALTALLDFSPTDAEGWAELADLYLTQGLYSQAIFALEEVLVLTPNAWNVHAKLGEALSMAAESNSEVPTYKYLVESVRRFARSVELCDNYLRGHYGLKIATSQLLSGDRKIKKQDDGLTPIADSTIEKLNEVATQKLGEIVRRYDAQEPLWQGYDAGEVRAARELIQKEQANIVR